MGSGGPEVRLQDSLSCHPFSLSGSDTPSELFPIVHPGNGVECCGSRSAGEGSSRAGSFFPWLLQSPVRYPQGHRGLASCDRPFTPQPFDACLSFPRGDSTVGSPVSSSGRLDGVPGSPGCLPSGCGAPVISALPEVLRGGFRTAVSGSVLRPFNCSASIHERHGSYLFHHACYGFRILRYLDDWLVLGSAFREIVRARDFLLWLCQELEVCINLGKNSLTPSQTLDYLEMSLQTHLLRVFPTHKRVLKLSSMFLELGSCRQQPLLLWRQLLGVMSSMSSIVPGSRLRMRPLQLRLNAAGRLLPDSASVAWVDSCLADLQWWSDESHLLVGLPLDLPQQGLALYTDALDSGWGAFLDDSHLSGLWSPNSSRFSINHRELLAVLYGVQGFLPVLRHQSVSLFVDNTTALSYLRNQGGSHSSTLNSVAQTILRLCEASQIRLVPQFVPGHLNVLADSLSRRSQVLGSEWTLCHQAFQELLRLWPATIDLFATALTARLHVYFSPVADPQSAGTDAMVQPWDGLQAYAFPPFGLLHCVLSKVQQFRGLELTLVAPFWPLVSGPSGASGGCSGVPPTAEGSAQTAPLPSLSPEPPRASADCISYLERSARSFGFSSAVARQLACCRRVSIRVNYQAKWAVYRAWCRRHGHSVSRPSVPKIASFLLYLRRSLSLSFCPLLHTAPC